MIIQPEAPTFLRFLKDNRQVAYATVLIIVIPLLLVLNTFFVARSMSANLDYEMRLKAEMTGKVIAAQTASMLHDPEAMQVLLARITEESLFDSIQEVSILVPADNDYQVLASSDAAKINAIQPQTSYYLAWREGQAIAQLVDRDHGKGQARVWEVVAPIKDNEGKLVGLIEIDVSTKQLDVQTQKVLLQSTIILVVSIVVVLLLIASNVKMFQFAVLFSKLQEVDQMKDDFIAVAAHELKTPVTAAKGFLSLIEMEGEQVPERVMSDLTKAKESLERLSDMVNDLLDVSRIEQQRLKLMITELDPQDILLKVVEEMRPAAESKGLVLIFRPSPSVLPTVSLDASKYRQVVTNLVSNAIKYTLHGNIEVSTEYHDLGDVRIHVQDTGIGMSAQEVEKLFTKFYRIRNRKARDVVGTGLGLWITKQLIEIMNGKIYVESVEDVGSKFTVIFPVAN